MRTNICHIYMCWNKEISINTFIFSCFSLALIYYNNNYTQYKLPEFQNPWVYIALLSFSSMQLIEYFLWKSIESKDTHMNYLWSIIGFLLVLFQPIAFLLILPSSVMVYRNILLGLYSVCVFLLFVYRELTTPITFITTVGKNRHLGWIWNWHDKNSESHIDFYIYYFLYMLLIGGSILYTFPYYSILFFGILLLLRINMSYNDITIGSMWCWLSNTIFIILLFKLLFLLPYLDKGIIC